MRQITRDAVAAFLATRPFHRDNTDVDVDGKVATLVLHGNAIAKHDGRGRLFITTAGWPTVTTKERLNGLPNVSVYSCKRVLHLNGQPWDNDNEWTEVKQS